MTRGNWRLRSRWLSVEDVAAGDSNVVRAALLWRVIGSVLHFFFSSGVLSVLLFAGCSLIMQYALQAVSSGVGCNCVPGHSGVAVGAAWARQERETPGRQLDNQTAFGSLVVCPAPPPPPWMSSHSANC